MTRVEAINALVGKSFNRLTAVKLSHRNKRGEQYWEFLCSCGNTKVIKKATVLCGRTRSCGCFQKEHAAKARTTHGRAVIGDKTYSSWHSLLTRISCKRGGIGYIGLTVSEEWKLFENFLRDMGERPEGKTIDRIDNTKGYCKENCRWATPLEQSRNRRKPLNKKTTSIYKGVFYLKKNKSWRATIITGIRSGYIGTFKTELEAGLAYNEAAKKHFGEFACLNPI